MRTAVILITALSVGIVSGDESVAQGKKKKKKSKQTSNQPAAIIDSSLSFVPVAQPVIEKDTLHLGDTLKVIRGRVERVQTVLDKITFGPQSYYFSRLRSWVIPLSDALNDSVAQYFFEVSDNDSSFIESRGDIQVIATPEPARDLVAMYFSGNSKERKGQRLREALAKKPDRAMYRQILESREYSEDKELIDRKFKIADLSAPKLLKDADSVHISFDRYGLGVDHKTATVMTIRVPDNLRVRFGDLWGVEVKLGYDEFSLPFWTSGNIAFLAIYNQIKVGGHIPFKWGTGAGSLSSVFKPRLLDGTYGVSTEFDWAFAGGAFLIGFPRSDKDGTFANPSDVYYIKAAANIWYSFTVSTGENANLFRFKTGLGIEQIGHDLRPTPGQDEFSRVETRFFWGPYFKMYYMNQGFARRFGVSLQYFKDYGTGGLWLEIIREQLRVELKFTAPLILPRNAWEPAYFMLLTIPYTFSL